MRWTDLPPDPGSAEARASALPRGEWEELRRRLERLPEGHPSRPDDVAETPAGESASREALADESSDPPGQPVPAGPEHGRPDDPERGASDRRGREPGRAGPRAPADLGGHGEREPYRPWFTTGESPEPWFAAEAD